MAIPVYMYLKDDGGNLIKGGVDVHGREHSIEVLGLHHAISLPTDSATGKITGARSHLPWMIEKEIDSSTPYLYKALTTGQRLSSLLFEFYHINNAGQEERYFNVLLEEVRVVSIYPVMFDVKDATRDKYNHMEAIEFRYEKSTWHYLDGNIKHSDSWNNRQTA